MVTMQILYFHSQTISYKEILSYYKNWVITAVIEMINTVCETRTFVLYQEPEPWLKQIVIDLSQ
jgi:hypothetical protein